MTRLEWLYEMMTDLKADIKREGTEFGIYNLRVGTSDYRDLLAEQKSLLPPGVEATIDAIKVDGHTVKEGNFSYGAMIEVRRTYRKFPVPTKPDDA